MGGIACMSIESPSSKSLDLSMTWRARLPNSLIDKHDGEWSLEETYMLPAYFDAICAVYAASWWRALEAW